MAIPSKRPRPPSPSPHDASAAPSTPSRGAPPPNALCCPITGEVMADPVVTACGITYDRAAISRWLARHDTDPVTRIVLKEKTLHANLLAKSLVREYVAEHGVPAAWLDTLALAVERMEKGDDAEESGEVVAAMVSAGLPADTQAHVHGYTATVAHWGVRLRNRHIVRAVTTAAGVDGTREDSDGVALLEHLSRARASYDSAMEPFQREVLRARQEWLIAVTRLSNEAAKRKEWLAALEGLQTHLTSRVRCNV